MLSKSRLSAAAAGAASLLGAVAAPSLAQNVVGGELFVSQTTSLPGSPGLGGAALTMSSNGFGVRASAGFNRRFDGYGVATVPWTADVDLFINSSALGQVIGIAMGSFMPVGFVGIGQQGIDEPGGASSSVTTLSYGAGASVPLFADLRLSAELRQRRLLSEASAFAPAGMGNGREIRLALTFGSRSGARPASRTTGRRGGGDVILAGGSRGSAASASARAVLATADQYLGSPYKYGGEDPRTGIDCSAFTQLVFRRNGVSIPRTSRQQVHVGREVLLDVDAMRPGDLLFFASNGSRIDHVAIYAGDYRIVHATASGGEVRYDDLRTRRGEWFMTHMVAARRVLDQGGSSLAAQFREALKLAPSDDRGDRAPRP